MTLFELKPFKTLKQRARKLNRRLPKAEQWFWSKWTQDKVSNFGDLANQPFPGRPYIADVINKFFKYVIEIDEPHHGRQVHEDNRRNAAMLSKGYAVFRIRAYNEDDYQRVKDAVLRWRRTGRRSRRAYVISHAEDLAREARIAAFKVEGARIQPPYTAAPQPEMKIHGGRAGNLRDYKRAPMVPRKKKEFKPRFLLRKKESA